MGEAAVDYVIDFIHGLSDAPAQNVDGALQEALKLKASPPEEGGSFDDVFAQFRDAAARAYETCGPGYLPYIPGGGLYASALGAVPRDVGQPLPQPVGGRARIGPDRAERDPVALRPVRLPRRSPRDPHDRRLDRESVCGGDRAPREARRGLRRRHLLRERAGPRLGAEGRGDRRASAARDAAGPGGRRTPDGRGGAEVDGGRGSRGRPPPVPRRPGRRDHQHRCDRSDGCGGRYRRGRGPVDARGCRLRRLLPPHRSWPGAVRRDRASRLDHVDPHKGMFLPYGTGSLVVRDGAALRDAHYVGAEYLQDRAPEAELPNWNEYSPELSRDHRGFRVWLPLVLHGVGAFRQALDEKLDLAEHLYAALAEMPEIELPWSPQLSVVPFRLAGASDDENRAFLARINEPETGVPVQHDDRRPPHHPGVHRQPPHASRPDRRGDRDHPSSRAAGEGLARARDARGPGARRAGRPTPSRERRSKGSTSSSSPR